MIFLPVVTREMSVLARRRNTYAARALMAVLGVLVLGWLLVSATAVSAAHQGRTVFWLLSILAFAFALLAGIHVTSDCLSEEKREGTLGLLFLTDLKSHDIVFGKMAASSLGAIFSVLGILPVISLALFLGGVSAAQVARLGLVLLTTIVLSLSIGVFVSSLSSHERKSMFASILILLVLTALPYLVGITLSGASKPSEAVTFISPAYPFLCVFASPANGLDPRYFWVAVAFEWLLASLCLAGAARILPRFVNDLPGRRLRWFRDFGRRMALGDPASRRRHRAALLDRNAFLWLAARERMKPRYAWLILAVFAAIYGWIAVQFLDLFFELPVSVTMLFLVHFSLKLWLASEVCSRLIEDRRSGALELLLTTPLGVRDIARGQSIALRRIFARPVSVLLLAELALLFGTLEYLPRTVEPPLVIACFVVLPATLLADLWALKWVGLWLSLRGKSIERVLLGAAARILAVPWIIFVLLCGLMIGAAMLTGYTPDASRLVLLWGLISLAVSFAFALPARFRFLRGFREAATQRFNSPVEKLSPELAKLAPSLRLPKLPNLRRRLAWAAALALLVLGPSARRLYWQQRVDGEIRRIRQEGFPAGLQSIPAYHPPIPAASNALAVLKEAGMINLGAFGRRVNLTGTFGLDPAQPMTPAQRASFESALASNQPQLAAFRKAMLLSGAWLAPAPDVLWRQPVDLLALSSLGWMAGAIAIEHADWDRSVQAVLDLLRCAALLRSQPAVAAQTAADNTLDKASQLLERLLRTHPLDPAALARIADQLALADPPVLVRSLIVRRALVADRLRGNFKDPSMPPNPFLAAIGTIMSGIGSRDRGLWYFLQSYRAGIAAAALPAPARIFKAVELDREGADLLLDVPAYFRSSYEMTGLFRLDAVISARVSLMRSAIAVERFRQAHARFPHARDHAVRETDPLSGDLLKTASDDRRFKIYSVGIDGKDEGGKPATDLVFSLWAREK